MSGVSEGSVSGPRLWYSFFNNLPSAFCILIVSLYNFADGESWSSFGSTVEDLIELLQSECNVDIERYIEKKNSCDKIFYPDNFQVFS